MDGVILATGVIASIYGIIGLLIGSEGAKAIKSSPNLKKLSRVRLD